MMKFFNASSGNSFIAPENDFHFFYRFFQSISFLVSFSTSLSSFILPSFSGYAKFASCPSLSSTLSFFLEGRIVFSASHVVNSYNVTLYLCETHFFLCVHRCLSAVFLNSVVILALTGINLNKF